MFTYLQSSYSSYKENNKKAADAEKAANQDAENKKI